MFDIIGDHIRSREANCIELASRLNFDFSNRLVEVGFDKMPLIEQSQFYRSLAKELRDKLKAVRRDQLICQLNKRAELAYELGNEQDLPAYSLESRLIFFFFFFLLKKIKKCSIFLFSRGHR
jgi:hypothetical protein